MNCELQRGSQPAQPFEPPSQRFTIVPLAAECVMPAKPVIVLPQLEMERAFVR
jgi:hypothetical protein